MCWLSWTLIKKKLKNTGKCSLFLVSHLKTLTSISHHNLASTHTKIQFIIENWPVTENQNSNFIIYVSYVWTVITQKPQSTVAATKNLKVVFCTEPTDRQAHINKVKISNGGKNQSIINIGPQSLKQVTNIWTVVQRVQNSDSNRATF